MNLADGVYDAVENFPKFEWFGLAQQMRRAAVSIPSNIAEGQGRGTLFEYRKFVRYARGSGFELETQIVLAARRHYITDETRTALIAQTHRVATLINGVLRSIARRIRAKTENRNPNTDSP